jgi:hypothetical protein
MGHPDIFVVDNGLAVDIFLGEPICYGLQGAARAPR